LRRGQQIVAEYFTAFADLLENPWFDTPLTSAARPLTSRRGGKRRLPERDRDIESVAGRAIARTAATAP
jgi:hypothetical protein